MTIPLILKWFLLPVLVLSITSSCELFETRLPGSCDQEEPLVERGASSFSLNLLQTQAHLTSTGLRPKPEHSIDKMVLATVLCGAAGILVGVMYLVMLTNRVSKAAIWSIFTKIVAAFIASLIVAALRTVTDHYMTEFARHGYLALPLFRFAVMFILVKSLMNCYCLPEDSLVATSTLGSFVLGFTAIDLFDGILRLDGKNGAVINFSQSPGSACIGALCCAGLFVVAMLLLTIQRRMGNGSSSNGRRLEQNGRWLEQSEEADDEAFSIMAGFLTCQVATYALMAKLYPTLEVPVLDEADAPYKPFMAVTMIYALWLVIGCNIWSVRRLKTQVHRIEYLIVRTLSMILVWCVLRWGQLVFWSSQAKWFGHNDPLLARLIAAYIFTAGSLLYVVLVTSVLKESKEGGTPCFHAFSSSLGLLIGQSWMTCVYSASAGSGLPKAGSTLLLVGTAPHAAHPGYEASYRYGICGVFVSILLFIMATMLKVYILPHSARPEITDGKEATATPAIDVLGS